MPPSFFVNSKLYSLTGYSAKAVVQLEQHK
ncbi:hypothetical protein EDC91_102238 [Shewanella fodinae]|jgi:hypothetical protein|uniref:Uncharacterized protein n=1 Tax=Shewanella fodinae TaxID=552357 RepID=A0A4R2FK56_9GAMM|nr:hypothetical protein EDC91_102238 [Shewanella fodinae]